MAHSRIKDENKSSSSVSWHGDNITELELARRRGELISKDDAKSDVSTLCRRIRAALDRAPSLLPGELSPEHQAACKSAMASAIKQALALL